jgi:polyisoprenoid-binding protein YceI
LCYSSGLRFSRPDLILESKLLNGVVYAIAGSDRKLVAGGAVRLAVGGIMELDRHRSADGLNQRGRSGVCIMLAALLVITNGQLRADPAYKVRGGKVSFSVGSNVPFLKVAGSSSAVKGSGDGTVAGNVAQVRNAHFELDPKTLKTGISLRDRHMYEQVFTAANGSITPVVLRTGTFQAKRNPTSGKWEASFQAQLTLHGATKPVRFQASAEQKGASVIISAEGVVKTSEFGVKPITYSGARVNDGVTVIVRDLRVEP